MSVRLDNRKQIQSYLKSYSKIIERTLIRELEIMVAKLENHAKDSAGYNDITGNLKGSIGGVVVKNGIPISYSGFEGEAVGVEEGRSFINSILSEVGTGYGIIIVAGMEYATYVENKHNLNVLKKSELKMYTEIPLMLEKMKRIIGNK